MSDALITVPCPTCHQRVRPDALPGEHSCLTRVVHAKQIHAVTVYCRACDAEHPAAWRETEPGMITVWLDRSVCPWLAS